MDKLYAPQDIERAHLRTLGKKRPGSRHVERATRTASSSRRPMSPVPLHMGHAFQHTLMDALTRHQRMRGADTLWQSGTDHAGIATQMVVERQLEAAGQHRSQLSR